MKKTIFFLLPLFVICVSLQAQSQIERNFSFCSSSTSKEGITISEPIGYTADRRYGFDLGTQENLKLSDGGFTANHSVYFSVKLPEGDYQIKVIIGSDTQVSETSVKAESRRLMVRETSVEKGKSKSQIFTVNLRTPQISPEEEINLKSRELDNLNWDDKLTLEFSGEVAVKSIEIKSVDGIKTIYLAGDSTVTDQDLEPWASWGQMITQYFTPEIVVANYAASGESLSSFKSRNRLKKILQTMQEGDFLFIEFGHNDAKIKGEGNGAYGIYSRLLKEYVNAAREKGGIPVLLTPTQRRNFNSNRQLEPTHGDFPDAMRKVALDLDVPLIDLTKLTTRMYESWGVENSKKALVHYPANTFPGQDKELADNTHFNVFGANEIALAIIEEIKNSDLGLKNYIRENTPRYNPDEPNNLSAWTLPVSPRFESTKPEGN